MSATCYVTDDKMTQHWNILTSWFPETPLRLEVAQRLLESRGLLDRCVILETRQATDEELALVHTKEHIERIRATEKMTLEEVTLAGYDIDPVTIMGQASNESARIAAGCLLQVIDAVAGGKCRNGVALIRPPGHHSSWDTVLGFCIFNNAAIAAKYAIQKHGLKRVMILDWDVHHGNGTQQIFYEDNSVLYVSLHRYSHEKKIFPFLDVSDASYVGEGVGKGYNVNVPWTKPAMTDADYLTAMCQLIMPIAIEYDPELVIVSAGFDSAKGDIMGDCCVTPAGYQHMTSLLKNLARGKVVIQLEGGYNVDVVAECLAACMGTLLGDPCLPVSNMKPSTSALASIEKARSALAPYWKCLTPEETPIVVEPTTVIETWEMPFPKCPHKDDIGEVSLKKCREQRNMSPEGLPTWICLKCSKVMVSEPKGEALAAHMKETGHRLTVNTDNLRVWCHSCSRYTVHRGVIPLLARLAKQGSCDS